MQWWFAWMWCWQVKTMMYSCSRVKELKHAATCHCDCVSIMACASALWTDNHAMRSGKPLSKCGKCKRYMKYIAQRPSRLYCPSCEEVYGVPQVTQCSQHFSHLLQVAAVQAFNSCRASRKLFHVRHNNKCVYIIDAYIWSAYSLHMRILPYWHEIIPQK